MKLWAVIPSGSRKTELANLVRVLDQDDVDIVVIDTGYEPGVLSDIAETCEKSTFAVFPDRNEPKNISRWWNLGLKKIAALQEIMAPGEEYVVAVLNDDIVIKSGFVRELAAGIFRHDVVLAYPDVFGLQFDQDFHGPSVWRMSGYAFALRGSAEIYADERFVWWGGDNDIEWQAFQKGGTAVIAGATCGHLYPNQSTVGELAEQAGRDRETFKNKWGVYAW